jgi:hypothetical protein
MSAIGSVIRYNSIKGFWIFDCRFAIFLAARALRNHKSKIQNHKFQLPTRFHDARDLTRQRQFTKANSAQVKLAQVRARTAASAATRIRARRKLRLAISFRD